jgi:hypothetical protein
MGQSVRAVAVLMVMHLAIAVVTYNCLVHIAAIRRRRSASTPQAASHSHAERRH